MAAQFDTTPSATDIPARFAEVSRAHGNPHAAARALRFPVQTFIRIIAGMPFREGTRLLAERSLAEYDAAALLARSTAPLLISTVPAAGDLPQ